MYRHLTQLLVAARLISRPQGVTIALLVERLGITRRTVYRLLEALDELGYPTYDDENSSPERCIKLIAARNNLKWWIPMPTIKFTFEDCVMLDYLFQEAASNPTLADGVRNLRRKLGNIVAEGGYSITLKDEGAGKALKNKPVLLHTAPVNKKMTELDTKHVKVLFQAFSEKCVCEVSYEAMQSGLVKTYKIHPLALFEHDGGLYVYVLVAYYETIRILAIERIRSIELTEDSFTPPDNFDAEKRLSDPFGIILSDPFIARIWFSADQVPYVQEREWGDGKIEKAEDGSIILPIETGGSYELKRWVMSYGADAELLEPVDIRNEIVNELKQAA